MTTLATAIFKPGTFKLSDDFSYFFWHMTYVNPGVA